MSPIAAATMPIRREKIPPLVVRVVTIASLFRRRGSVVFGAASATQTPGG